MENLDRIFDKLDHMDERLGSIDRTLVEHNCTLQEHVRRSLANEKAVETLKAELKPILFESYAAKLTLKFACGILGSGLVLKLINYFLSK